MKRLGTVKFPNSVQLFRFCQRILIEKKGSKTKDQELGEVLGFNPSDCSHWKKGDKNVRSVFILAKLAKFLDVEETLLHDIVNGVIGEEEAYFEYKESREIQDTFRSLSTLNANEVEVRRKNIENLVSKIHDQLNFSTPPLFLPELVRCFSFVNIQAVDMVDRISRVLKTKTSSYAIQYLKGEFKAQTRMSIIKDLAKIILIGERARYQELGSYDKDYIRLEVLTFVSSILVPKRLLVKEMNKIDLNKNIVNELSLAFWVPKSLIAYQMQDIIRFGLDAENEYSTQTNREQELGY